MSGYTPQGMQVAQDTLVITMFIICSTTSCLLSTEFYSSHQFLVMKTTRSSKTECLQTLAKMLLPHAYLTNG